jgi:hypothetical protein
MNHLLELVRMPEVIDLQELERLPGLGTGHAPEVP